MLEVAIIVLATVVMVAINVLILRAWRRRFRSVLADLVELRALELLRDGDGD